MNQITKNNKAHYKALAECEAFIANGGVIKQLPITGRAVIKKTINPKSGVLKGSGLNFDGLSAYQKVKKALSVHGELMRMNIYDLTGVGHNEISKIVTMMANDNFVKRKLVKGKGIARETRYIWTGK